MTAVLAVYNSRGCVVRLSNVQSVEQRMRLGMRCRLSPTADVPSHTSKAAMGQKTDFGRGQRAASVN